MNGSVWIDHLNDRRSSSTLRLRSLIGHTRILVGDLILLEVLQGLRTEREASRIEQLLSRFETASMLEPALAIRAAANYRRLRSVGVTVRKTIDLTIGTFCIERGHRLLHDDRDFDPMATYLGLKILDAR